MSDELGSNLHNETVAYLRQMRQIQGRHTIHPNATFATLRLLSSFALAAKKSVAAVRATGDKFYGSSCIQGRFYLRNKI